jgi:hypothetical protein
MTAWCSGSPPPPGLAASIADLAQREHSCCAFFDFAIRIGVAEIVLEIGAPAEAASLLDAFLVSS